MSATLTEDLKLSLPGRIEGPGAGWTWIVEGWRLFAKAPLMWIISVILLLIVVVALRFVPYIGPVALLLLLPVFLAGFVVACRSLERGGEFEIEHLFAGFRMHVGNLVIVGALTLVGIVAILLVFAAFVGVSILAAVAAGNTDNVIASVGAAAVPILLGSLVALALAVPIAAATYFAPALVVMHGMTALAAMKASLVACFRAFVPFLVYGIVMMVLAFLAMIPVFLGLFVFIPLTITSSYAAYRHIFTEGAVVVPA